MSQSFSAARPGSLAELSAKRRKVLVTGAAGNIGSYFAEHSHQKYDLVLIDRSLESLRKLGVDRFGQVLAVDITDLEALKSACVGVDTVLHLAANASPEATWSTVRDINIGGTYNVFVAAKSAECRRVVYASSIHAVSGYPGDVQVKTCEPVNPGDLYGVSKCFGEAMGRYMAEQEGVSVIALRIGAFQPVAKGEDESSLELLDAFVSRRDLHQLIERSIDVESIKFAVVHGLSDNRFKRLDISDARDLLGYAPQDDSAALNPLTRDLDFAGTLAAHSMQDEGRRSGLREEL